MAEHAVKAYSELDGSILDGRMLHLLPAKMKANPMEELDESRNKYFAILFSDSFPISACNFLHYRRLNL